MHCAHPDRLCKLIVLSVFKPPMQDCVTTLQKKIFYSLSRPHTEVMRLWAHSIASVTRMKNVSADLNSFIIDMQIMFCKLPAEPERASPL